MSARMRFRNRGVLVTGASRGLGRAVAEAFGGEGARVAVTYRVQRAKAEQTAAAVEAAGGAASVHELDVRDPDAVSRVVGDLEAEAPIDVLVNNAAVLLDRPFLTLTKAEWGTTVDTNLTGTYHACRAVLTRMMARGGGAIVNVASVAAVRASVGQAAYAASKAAILGLTRNLASEVADRGVRVNAVVPGYLEVGMGARVDRRVAERASESIPLGRFGTGAEVAAAILFLASDEAGYVVGQHITVDGGLSL